MRIDYSKIKKVNSNEVNSYRNVNAQQNPSEIVIDFSSNNANLSMNGMDNYYTEQNDEQQVSNSDDKSKANQSKSNCEAKKETAETETENSDREIANADKAKVSAESATNTNSSKNNLNKNLNLQNANKTNATQGANTKTANILSDGSNAQNTSVADKNADI